VLDLLGADALRHFLLREVTFGQDGSFSFDALVQRYNADLANGYGNLVSRTLAMIAKYFDGVVPEGLAADSGIQAIVEQQTGLFDQRLEQFDFSRALEHVWSAVAAVDGYITAQAPWKIAANDDAESRAKLAGILYNAAEAIRIITALVYPVIPEAATKVWQQLGLGDITEADLKDLRWGDLSPGTKLGELGPVFPRAEKEAIERMKNMEEDGVAAATGQNQTATDAAEQAAPELAAQPELNPAVVFESKLAHAQVSELQSVGSVTSAEQAAAADSAKAKAAPPNSSSQVVPPVQPTQPHSAQPAPSRVTAPAQPNEDSAKIGIEDFAKVDLRVAVIRVAERVPKADRLLRLEVDLGYEQRQIVAGIAEAYAPESLIGRKVVIVANLAPRKLRGLESNGMIVAASIGEKGTPVLAGFLEDVEIGARLK
jgi:methionyl-tRNA synthetase